MRNFLKYNRNALLWAFLILLLCIMPVKSIPSFRLLDLFSFDKLAHMALFFIQFWFTAIGLSKQYVFSYKRKRVGIIAFIVTISYGAVIELIQGYVVSGRSMDIMDVIANIIGASLGWLNFLFFSRKSRRI